MKRILFIVYHYFPDSAIGAQRSIKFAKYLPQYGWKADVLSIDQKYYPKIEIKPLGFDQHIVRTDRWLLPDDIYRSLKKKISSPSSATKSKKNIQNISPTINNQRPMSLFKKFVNSISSTPDIHVGWLPPAVRTALKMLEANNYDAIYTSGPPHSSHLIGLHVSSKTGIPWVADFRDPWYYPRIAYQRTLELSQKFDKRFERKTIEQASLVLTTTDEWRDQLKERFSPILDTKCHTLINGFDDEDFKSFDSSVKKDKNDKIIFLHGGTLYVGRDPSTMLIAAGELLKEGSITQNDIEFRFYGSCNIDMNNVHSIIEEYNLQDIALFRDAVGYDDYMKLLAESDVLVLFQSEAAEICIPAKTFEYLATKKRVLTLSPPGATSNFSSKFEQVSVSDPNNVETIKIALMNLVNQIRSGSETSVSSEKLQEITKRKLTGDFAELLNQFIK